MERSLISWKKFVKSEKEKRKEEERRKEKEREEMNAAKADWFREKNLTKHHLDRWRGLAKLMARKRQLRELEKQKLKSQEKINLFLQNLQEAVKPTDKSPKKEPPTSTLKKELKMTSNKKPVKRASTSKDGTKLAKPMPANESPTKPSSRKLRSTESKEKKSSPLSTSGNIEKINVVKDDDAIADKGPDSRKVVFEDIQGRSNDQLKSYQQRKLEEREVRALEKMKSQIEKGHAVTDTFLYRRVLQTKEDNNDSSSEDEEESSTTTYENRRSKSSKKVGKFLSHEIRAGDVLQIRLQADLHDNEFAKKSPHYETDCSVSKTQLKGGNKSKTPIRNIIVKKELLPPLRADNGDDPSELKYFGNTEAYKNLQTHKLSPEEGFLERMKLRQKERERKRNEIRKFHQLRAEESRRKKAEENAMMERLQREDKERKKNELKMFKRKEKAKEKEREIEKERQQTLSQVAINWRRKKLLSKSLQMFKSRLSDRKIKEFLAEKLYERKTYKKYFDGWSQFKQSIQLENQMKAETFYSFNLKQKMLKAWMCFSQMSIRKIQAAHDLCDFKRGLRTFETWRNLSKQSSVREAKLTRKATLFYKTFLVRKYWSMWLKFMSKKDEIRARDEIRQRLEKKVAIEINGYVPSRLREVY